MTSINEAAQPAAADAPLPIRRIFLTGGSGYVGRNLVRHFVAEGVAVVALARSPQSVEIVSALGAQPFAGDLFSPDLVEGMAGCDVLIHAAADLDHGVGSTAQQRVNEDGTRAVFEAARAAGVQKAIMVSTESVLADGQPLVNVDETHPFPRRPAGSYSASKARAERLALAFNGSEMAVIAVRPRMVWGRDDTTALPQLLGAVRSGQFAWISGGDYQTSTIHIANLCAGIECAIRNGHGGEVYFLADDEPVQFRQFVSAMLATQGVTAPDKSVPWGVLRAVATIGSLLHKLSGGKFVPPLTLQAYATSAVEITLNIDKARRELGYVPVMSREAGLAEMVKEQLSSNRR
ncbi:NAD-dependent epimerase/dehydratase family protein [Devosia submarina]|uniref:NAD-dependent epimerase/dehydratase family protein n=1 Tax=Devosia submarina TaxID=1173082 RepID=UPI000D347F2C|nr:NAD-dependent epimerase/dehydratase family protein [Devosia submarina]